MNEQKAGLSPAVIGLLVVGVLAVAFLVWNLTRGSAQLPTGTEVQKPTGLAPDPSQLPPGGRMNPTGLPAAAPMPPGKGGR